MELLVTDYEVRGLASLPKLRIRIERHLRPFFQGKKAQDISLADGKDFTAVRQAEGAANGSINREVSALKLGFHLAIQAERLYRKPYIPRLPEKNVRQGFVERWEYEAVLAKLPEYLCPPVMFAYQVGWRVMSEMLPLTWEQVDLEVGTVRLEVGTTKTKKGRLVYLPNLLRGVLESQWREHLAYYPDCPYVFHRSGNEIRYPYVAWRRACKEAALAGKIPHDFRRTAVRNMARAGIPERVAMEIAGHKTRSIFDRYHIVSEGDLKEATECLDAAFEAQTMTKTMTKAMTTDCCEATAPRLRH